MRIQLPKIIFHSSGERADIEMAKLLHTYTDDLRRLTLLRDNTLSEEKRERYDDILDVAQKTLQRLLELNEEKQEKK